MSKLRIEPRHLGFPSRVPSIPPCGLSVDSSKTTTESRTEEFGVRKLDLSHKYRTPFCSSLPSTVLKHVDLEKGLDPRAPKEER